MGKARDDRAADQAPPSFGEAARVWARIGLLSFGGPAGQIALMHRIVVDEKRWIGEERFLHALNYCMLLPGPEAQQLAVYLGWLMHRIAGGLVAGLLFILPGAALMLALSIVYALYNQTPLVAALFFGIKAAVLAIVVQALVRIVGRALKNRAMIAISIGAFAAIFVFGVPFPIIILVAGIIGWIGSRYIPVLSANGRHGDTRGAPARGLIDILFERGELAHTRPSHARALKTVAVWLPLWLLPVAVLWLAFPGSVWPQIAGFFSVMSVVTFGGAYAVLAYVAQAAVEAYGWLAPGEMVDGLGLAETTPGPLILVLQFVGFLAAYRAAGTLDPVLAGTLGAVLTLWVTFVPCFFWIFLGAPYVEKLRGNTTLSAAMAAITAAVVGVIANLALWFALHVIFREVRTGALGSYPDPASVDWRAALITALAFALVFRLRLGIVPVLAVCAATGAGLWFLPV